MLLKKTKKTKNKFNKIKKIGLLFLVIIFTLFFIYNHGINTSSSPGDKLTFKIESGQSVSSITDNLKKEGLIKSAIIFKVYVKLSGQQSSFRVGSYELKPSMSIKEVVLELTKKNFLKPEERLTFIEGWSLKDYARLLDDKNLVSTDEFLYLVDGSIDYSGDFQFLKDKPKIQGLEGYLFPDTYRFFIDVSSSEIINKMLLNFDKKLTSKMREDIYFQGKNIHEIIIMASIIEKEVRSEKDMKIVSGIFWNRIKYGQALESCATLAFILGVNKAQYSYEDTRIKSPYNTYVNRGLPPGPIASPGIKAIEAAIYPQDTNYNYFLTSSDTGETIFSRTYEEHIINKNKHIK